MTVAQNPMAAMFGAFFAELAQKSGMSMDSLIKAGSATGTPVGPYLHGPGGLFSTPGLDRELYSTHVIPQGIAGMLPAVSTNEMNPLFAYVTGFTDITGANPAGVCDDPPTVGTIKGCHQISTFGLYGLQTTEIDIRRIGQVNNRGESDDLVLLNPVAVTGNPFVPTAVTGTNIRLAAADEFRVRLLELGVGWSRLMARQTYEGNPAVNTAGYQEFAGLNILINTVKYDAITGVTCPSLASDVRNFNYALLDDNGPALVEVIVDMIRYANHTARATGLDPATFALAMRAELFYEITAVWPCSYLTARCIMATGGVLNLDAGDVIAMRNAMRNGSYLEVDGVRVDVVIDDGIREYSNTDNANVANTTFSSDIYLLPMTVAGGRRPLYWQFFDFSAALQATQDAGYGSTFWSDGGRFLFKSKTAINWCIQILSTMRPRLVLRTPQLAGRLQNVRYQPLKHTRQALPTEPYFLNGGITGALPLPVRYSEYNLP